MTELSDILLEYSETRTRNSLAGQRKREEFLSRPGARELTDRRAELFRQAGIASLRGNEKARAEAERELGAVSAELAARFGEDWEKAFAPLYTCEICRDTGYDTSGNGTEMCSCLKKKIYERIYGGEDPLSMPGFGDYLAGCENLGDDQKAFLRALKKYALDKCACPDRNFILFTGSSGLGKTYVMGCMANRLASEGKDVLFMTAQKLFSLFHASRLGSKVPLAPLYSAEYLFVDDLGTEPVTQNVTREYMYRLVSERIKPGLMTVLSSNLTEQALKDRYGEKVTSRLFDRKTGDSIALSGSDIRLIKQP